VRLLIVALVVGLASCTRYAVRDATTYSAEVAASTARQEEAADALLVAAERAREAGDLEACEEYAAPALLIEAAARQQGNRALWLAGIPYLDPETGQLPPKGEKQPDPGPSPDPRPVAAVCGPQED